MGEIIVIILLLHFTVQCFKNMKFFPFKIDVSCIAACVKRQTHPIFGEKNDENIH